MDIVATSGAFTADERGGMRPGPVFRQIVRISRNPERPRVCLVETASGDSDNRLRKMYAGIGESLPQATVTHLALFPMPNVDDIRHHLLNQDVVWVGGGSIVNLLAVWRAHGLDEIMREAWEAGVVLSGSSAGSMCWHTGGNTDSYGPDLQVIDNCLGFLPFSNSPHYDSQQARRPLYQKLVGDGTLSSGWATDEGVALHYRGQELVDVFSQTEGACAWRVERVAPDVGAVLETRVKPRLLTGR